MDAFSPIITILQFQIDGWEMDTTAVTGGEAPTKTFKVSDTVKFNDATGAEKANGYSIDGGGVFLHGIRQLEDVAVSGRTVESRIDFSATGNKMTELSFKLYKE